MATVDAFSFTHESSMAPPRHQLPALRGDGGGTTTITYCYRTSLGTRGTTTDPGAIPAGAEVERTVTT